MSINLLLKSNDVDGLQRVLNTYSAFEVADVIAGKIPEEQLLLFSVLSPKLAAETFDYLPPRVQKKLLKSLPSQKAATILNEMPPDDRTALLQHLPRAVFDEYIKLLSPEERTLSVSLLGYPEDSIGRMMTTDFITCKMNWTIQQVLNHIRAYGHDSETINVIYVVDDAGKLLDDIKIKEFLFAPQDYKVAQITTGNFISLSPYEKAEEAIRIFKKFDRIALPVIDSNGILLGIVTIDDVLRLMSKRATENIQKVGGSEALDEPYMEAPFSELMKKRARWLILLFIGEMFTATAMGFFEAEISKAVVLALFLPLIISSGGNAGSQSSTLIIRAMALGEVRVRDWWKVMKREILSGLCLGLILGCIGFTRVALWSAVSGIYGAHWLLVACTIFLALIGVVFWGSLFGSLLPMLLKKAGVDPAVASAPLIATIVDVTGIVIYFVIAAVVLKNYLL